MDEARKDFDILEFPIEGVAAYWLSIKKLVGNKRNAKALEQEAEHTGEPYIKYLLDLCFSALDDETFRRMAEVRRAMLLALLGRKLDLMRVTLLDIAGSENPRKTLAKLSAQFGVQELTEEKAFHLAQELAKMAGSAKRDEYAGYFNVDHRLEPDKLMVTLLFYVILARHESKMALQAFLKYIRSNFFAEGLSLVSDGFDAPFVRKRLQVHRDVVLTETRLKMEMAAEMCFAIRNRLAYDDVFRIAKAYLP